MCSQNAVPRNVNFCGNPDVSEIGSGFEGVHVPTRDDLCLSPMEIVFNPRY